MVVGTVITCAHYCYWLFGMEWQLILYVLLAVCVCVCVCVCTMQQLAVKIELVCVVCLFWECYICLVLCYHCPGEFATYLNFCRSLKFEDKPDYTYLRQLFRNLFHRLGFTYDYVFDWNTARIVSTSSSLHELFSLLLPTRLAAIA